MKKNMKKVVSVVLAVMMVFAMAVTTFAADTTLTINAAEGHTYTVYQMLVGDVSSLVDGRGTLANVTAGAQLSGTVEEFDAAIKGTDGKYLTGTALAAAAEAKIDATKGIYGTYSGSAMPVASGYYVVKDSYTDSGVECSAYMVAVVGPTTMEPKTTTTDIDKNITDEDANAALEAGNSKKTDTAAIGDKINYESKSVVPVTTGYKYYYYVVTDTMSTGLTYNKDLVIKIGTGDTAVTLVKGTDYTITETDRGFELVINDMKDLSETKGLAGKAITITYSATVNENAEIGKIPNTNDVYLKYSNNPSDTYDKKPNDDHKPGPNDVVGITPTHTTKTYVTQVTIQKTDADADIFTAALQGAEFKLTGTGLNDVKLVTETTFVEATDGTYYLLKDGTYTEKAPIPATADNTGNADKYANDGKMYKATTTTTLQSVNDGESGSSCNVTATVDPKTGKITFTGLNAGTYKIEETKVPAGYNKCADIDFTISATQTGATALVGGDITWSSTNDKVVLNEAMGVFDVEIENQKGNTLPSTGGVGTTIFYVLGTILVLGAGVLMVARRRAR